MLWIVIALCLLALGGLYVFVRMISIRRASRVSLVVMIVALLIAVASVLLVGNMLPLASAG